VGWETDPPLTLCDLPPHRICGHKLPGAFGVSDMDICDAVGWPLLPKYSISRAEMKRPSWEDVHKSGWRFRKSFFEIWGSAANGICVHA